VMNPVVGGLRYPGLGCFCDDKDFCNFNKQVGARGGREGASGSTPEGLGERTFPGGVPGPAQGSRPNAMGQEGVRGRTRRPVAFPTTDEERGMPAGRDFEAPAGQRPDPGGRPTLPVLDLGLA
jgi:hypothetical protein